MNEIMKKKTKKIKKRKSKKKMSKYKHTQKPPACTDTHRCGRTVVLS